MNQKSNQEISRETGREIDRRAGFALDVQTETQIGPQIGPRIEPIRAHIGPVGAQAGTQTITGTHINPPVAPQAIAGTQTSPQTQPSRYVGLQAAPKSPNAPVAPVAPVASVAPIPEQPITPINRPTSAAAPIPRQPHPAPPDPLQLPPPPPPPDSDPDPETREEAEKAVALSAMTANFGREFPPALLNLWLDRLKTTPPALVRDAAWRLIETCPWRGLPTFCQFRQALLELCGQDEKSQERMALAEWGALQAEVAAKGSRGAPRLHPTTAYVVELLGGWFAACMWERAELDFRRRDFLAIWPTAHGKVGAMRAGAAALDALAGGTAMAVDATTALDAGTGGTESGGTAHIRPAQPEPGRGETAAGPTAGTAGSGRARPAQPARPEPERSGRGADAGQIDAKRLLRPRLRSEAVSLQDGLAELIPCPHPERKP